MEDRGRMIKEDWKECKLGEVLTIKYGKNQKEVESPNGTIPIYGTGGLMGYATKFLYDKPSILIGRKGTINKVKFIDKPFWTVDTLFYSIINEEIVSPKFLYYQLSLINFMNYNEGTTIPSLRTETLNRIEVSLPPLATQQKIATILSSLDDKIELNNKINDNLEQQAQAIFKSWFVDFEPFGGKMPEGWRVGKVDDLGEIICGKTPSTKIKEYYGNECPFITIPDMHNNVYACFTERYLSKLGMESQIGKSLPVNSVCVSCIATPGLVILTDKISQTNQQINSIIPNKNMSSYYVYLLMQSLAETIKMLGSSGSTTSNLNKDQFSKIDVLIPAIYELKIFNTIVEPLFQNIRNNIHENQKLTALRDTLLPKLMSGEINVESVKI